MQENILKNIPKNMQKISKNKIIQFGKKSLLISACVLLMACGQKIELQTNIPENEANEMVAVLLKEGINAEKLKLKEGASVLVPNEQVGQAMDVLTANGLPRKQNMGLGEVFKKEGMISTPLEERVRYIFGLSQELERTLGQMDYVVNARVHVVLPERVAPGEPIMPSSASVFIKHRKGFDPDLLLPSIRKLVATSIPGLSQIDKEKISVVFSMAQEGKNHVEWSNFGPIQVQSDSAGALQTLFFALILTNLLMLAGLVFVLFKPHQARKFLRLEKPDAKNNTSLSANQNSNPYQD